MASVFSTTTYLSISDLADSTTITALKTDANRERLIILWEDYIDSYIWSTCWESEVDTQARIFPARKRGSEDVYEIPTSIKQALVLLCEMEYLNWLVATSEIKGDIVEEKSWERTIKLWKLKEEIASKKDLVKSILDKFRCSFISQRI